VIGKTATRLAVAHRTPSRDEIRGLLRLPDARTAFSPRHLVTTARNGYTVEKIEFLSEPGIYIPAWIFHPVKARGPASLFVSDGGKQAEGMEFGLLERLVRKGHTVMAVDVRGIGETRPPHPPSSDRPGEYGHLFNVETAMTYMAWYMDRDLFGMRVYDVLRSAEFARDRFGSAVRIAGRGAGALWALYAGALDERVPAVLCERALASYRTLLEADRYSHQASVLVRGIYRRFDLPQLAALFSGRELKFLPDADNARRVDVYSAFFSAA
jgi:cephalosporin-C deacetylase-like acetyl esterase